MIVVAREAALSNALTPITKQLCIQQKLIFGPNKTVKCLGALEPK